MEGGHIGPTPTVGGEVFPQTPAFPISPQTPYFNLCKSPNPADRWHCGAVASLEIQMICIIIKVNSKMKTCCVNLCPHEKCQVFPQKRKLKTDKSFYIFPTTEQSEMFHLKTNILHKQIIRKESLE